MASITSANSNFTVKIADLFPGPNKLQGYATDDAWDTEDVELAEVSIGVDGEKSEGYVFSLVTMVVHFAASSTSLDLFDEILRQSKANKQTYRLDGQLIVPATSKVYDCVNGTVTRGKVMPDGKRVLQPRTFTIVWQSIDPAAQ